MTPGHVQTLEDYWVWLDELVNRSGGWLDDAALYVFPIESSGPFAEPEDYIGLYVPPQRLTFGDGSHMKMTMVVDSNLLLTEYSFHYQEQNGRLIWRKCNHVGHDVGLLHIHRRPNDPDRVDVFNDVDLEETIEEVWAYMQEGSRP